MPIAIIGAAAAIGGAAISASATKSAANTAAESNAANQAAIEARYQDTRSLELPTVNAGDAATSQISGLLNLGGDPAASAAAFKDYTGSTGLQFQLDTGVNAITSSRAASGSLDSGGTLKALDQYGQNLGQSYFSNYLTQVGGVADRGTNATNALAGAGQAATSATVASNTAAADTTANAALAGAGQTNGLLTSLAGIYALGKGKSSYNAVTGSGSGNPFATVG